MTVDSKEVVTTIAYMIGVKKSVLEQCFKAECEDTLNRLYADREATVIRYLCKLRTTLFRNFKKTDQAIYCDQKNLMSIDYYDHDNIRQLEKLGFEIIHANYRAEKYMLDFTRLINENIDKCSRLFYDWINWDYIKDLFYIPKYNKPNVMINEFNKYMGHIGLCLKSVERRKSPIPKENIDKRSDNRFMNSFVFRKTNGFSCKTLNSCS